MPGTHAPRRLRSPHPSNWSIVKAIIPGMYNEYILFVHLCTDGLLRLADSRTQIALAIRCKNMHTRTVGPSVKPSWCSQARCGDGPPDSGAHRLTTPAGRAKNKWVSIGRFACLVRRLPARRPSQRQTSKEGELSWKCRKPNFYRAVGSGF